MNGVLDETVTFKFGDKYRGNYPKISEHAIERAKERFKVTQKESKMWIQNQLVFAKYVNKIKDGTNRYSYIFRNKNVLIAISEDLKTISTVMDADWKVPKDEIKDSVYDLSQSVNKVLLIKFKKVKEKYNSTLKRNKLLKAELKVELAQVQLKLLRAKSESHINAYKAREKAIKDRLNELDEEVLDVERQNNQITHSISLFMEVGEKISGMD